MRHVLVALGVCSLLSLASCQSTAKAAPRTIAVSGTGSVQVEPDIATFNVWVKETRKTTSEALAATNQKIALVLETLKAQGVQETDIATDGINLSPDYAWDDASRKQVLVGQASSQSLSVKVRDLDTLGPIIDSLGAIDGISLQSIQFDKEDKSAAYDQARTKAVEDAYAKALSYAGSLNQTVGEPVMVTEGGVDASPAPMYKAAAMSMDALAATSVPSGTLSVSTDVTVVFALQ